MFKKYNITTFCAPPTMYRMLIKQDLSRFDLSSIQHATTAGEALNAEVFYQFRKATGLAVHEGFGLFAGDGLDAPDAGRDGRFADDAEEADVAGRGSV